MQWSINAWIRAGVVGGAGVLLAAGIGTSAVAGEDTEPPVLRTPERAQFVRGSQVTGWEVDPEFVFTENIQARVPWRAWDRGSGICDVTVDRVKAGAFEPAVVTGAPAFGSYTDIESDYDDQFGGGAFKIQGWLVTATDCAGNTTTNEVAGRPVATQEDNSTAGYPGVTISYRGPWSTDECSDCLAGAAAVTSRRRAAAIIEAVPGSRVALVMRTGPKHGVADIYVDGRRRDRVSTWAPEPTERTIVWTRQLRDHESTITIVNRGWKRRPLMGLDAVLVR